VNLSLKDDARVEISPSGVIGLYVCCWVLHILSLDSQSFLGRQLLLGALAVRLAEEPLSMTWDNTAVTQ